MLKRERKGDKGGQEQKVLTIRYVQSSVFCLFYLSHPASRASYLRLL